MKKVLIAVLLLSSAVISAHATPGMPRRIKIKVDNAFASSFEARLDEIELSRFELQGTCRIDDPSGLNWQLYSKYLGEATLSYGSKVYRLESAKVLQINGAAQGSGACELNSLSDLQQMLPQVLIFQNADSPKEKLVMTGYVDKNMKFVPERIREFNKPGANSAYVELLESY